MNFRFNTDLISNYKSNSQISRVLTEDWVEKNMYCPICGDSETYPVEISYAFKLLLDELKSLCIFPKLVLGDKA